MNMNKVIDVIIEGLAEMRDYYTRSSEQFKNSKMGCYYEGVKVGVNTALTQFENFRNIYNQYNEEN